MPVDNRRLIPLLALFVFSYLTAKLLLDKLAEYSTKMHEIEESGQSFRRINISSNVVKYVSTFSARQFWTDIQENEEFLGEFLTLLKVSPFKAFFFETPSVKASTMNGQFEFVLSNAGALEDIAEDREAFNEHFSSDSTCVSFPNIGGDAVLVVPTPLSTHPVYAHLAHFVTHAPHDQVKDFWRLAGKTAIEKVDNNQTNSPLWISTSGLGIYWLHLRFDSSPKYYTYWPYRNSV